ncbi:MAG: aspartate aminotransferase family protein [Saprospiraceae bacterium]|nr:aspartate aminotransferase family protein [Saprospiraceae bacterium]
MNLRQQFLAHVAPTSPFPLALEIVKGSGVYLYDSAGKSYLDLIAGISVSSLGHCHPKVVAAAKAQLDTYLHTMVYGEYVLAPQVKLATLMAANLPNSLNSVYFVNSGSEATEGAMKLAKRATGRHEIIACYRAYHGSTQGSASLMNPMTFTQAYYPLLPNIKHIDFNCDYCLYRITEKTAAVIVETVQAEWGVRTPANDYLKKLRQRCSEVGALLILDEIQVGYGRTGSLWAFEQYDIVPDVLLLAKAMGGGMPIGAFVAHQSLMAVLSNHPILGHITTFGGHPVSCAAAHATLEVLLEEDWIPAVPKKVALFQQLLQHKAIKDFRTAGFLMALELDNFEQVQQVVQACLKRGVIVDWFLFNDRSLRLAPPLIISETQIEIACGILLESLHEVLD